MKDKNVKIDGSHVTDPRKGLFQSHQNELETWTSHGEYPKADDYSFYLGYHSLMMAAAILFNTLPIKKDAYEDKWRYWLKCHMLTREDGYWLSDRRDPIPITRRDWVSKKQSDVWLDSIIDDDFLDCLLTTKDNSIWLNVAGNWSDNNREYEETISITSALVNKKTSTSLLNAFSTCSNPFDYRLPECNEDNMQIDQSTFKLKGWLYSYYLDSGLDQFDSHAANISFNPYCFCKNIVKEFNLYTDVNSRNWKKEDANDIYAINEIWSENDNERRDESIRHGNKLAVSLSLIKDILIKLDYDMIFEVQIKRNKFKSKYSGRNYDTEYKPSVSKVYLFSENGEIRDIRKSYLLR